MDRRLSRSPVARSRGSLALRSVIITICVAAVAFACGSGSESEFVDPNAGLGEEAGPPPPGNFNPIDAGKADGSACKALTCKDVAANCGPIGDGCGGLLASCGTCAGEETCGGGGKASVCGKAACTPKDCTALGANCGAAGDGCGGVITTCGTCSVPGEICGGGGPSRCGTGLGGDAGADGGAACVAKTCADLGANCGPAADGCGGLIPSCGSCGVVGQTCGGGGTPSVCGGNACVKKTCAGVGANCGPIADGCGGIVQCGGCAVPGQICGGGGTPSVCGGAPVNCTGLCTQQKACPGGGTTTITGTVTTPAGNLPIYGALVYVPNAPVAAFPTGVSCDQCGAAASGSPLVSTTTAADGTFLLPNVPVSDPAKVDNIPVVIQLGRWRKQFTVQTTACANTVVDAAKTALPKNKTEGDIPLTAISTGAVDGLECVLRKIGIQDSEFTNPSGNGRIRLYQDNGARITKRHCSSGPNDSCGGSCKAPKTCIEATPSASTLYGSQTELDKHDLVIFGCVGSEQSKTAGSKQRVQAYANKGGRVYATHYSYVWLNDYAPWSSTAPFTPSQDAWNLVTADVDTSFSKGAAFAQWLSLVGALSRPLPNPQIQIEEARHDVDMPVVAPAQRWLSTNTTDAPKKSSLQHYTFNTEWGKPAAQQCGRVLFSDFHVTVGQTQDVIFPGECDNDPLTAQEKVLAFMLFDLASCITNPNPPAPVCPKKTCADQGIQCGGAGDGCGNEIDCGPCPVGTSCGGGGVASKCGAPPCNKLVCAANECGTKADGCGGTVVCPPCAAGMNCGGGGPNLCGAPVCNKLTCAAAPADTCGPTADGCGGIIQCMCPGGEQCVNGKCGAPPCNPRTCAQAGANCGTVADGCGGTMPCGDCLAPQTCGGGGNANVCGGGVN